MTDIVDRLLTQHERGVLDLPEDHVFVGWRDAAIEIDRLNAEIARLREALQDIADEAWHSNDGTRAEYCHPEGCESPGIARAALAGEEKKP